MHTLGLVIGENHEKQLEKYSSYLEVKPYKKYLDKYELEDMAEDYDLDKKTLRNYVTNFQIGMM